jgi:hypothetical protein
LLPPASRGCAGLSAVRHGQSMTER